MLHVGLNLHKRATRYIYKYLLAFMAIPVVEFSNRGKKLERFLHKNQLTQRKLLEIYLTIMDNEIWVVFQQEKLFV